MPIALVVMAKQPVPGRAKTRLCPPLAPAQVAALAPWTRFASTLELVTG
jgi:hypothetical protein